MFTNDTVDLKELIKITSSGIKVATFAQIKASLIQRYKQIYGSDIDVSDTCADGIFINDLALIINNMIQSVQTAYTNLDINTANGVYLDRLCALTNIVRKPATQSLVYINIENLDTVNAIQIENGLQFVDKAGIIWEYIGETFSLAASANQNILLQCQEYGVIEAPANWIYKTVEVMTIGIVQSQEATPGSEQETDRDLRARQAASNGNQGITVIDGIINDLRNIEGIEDVFIYNNNTGSDTDNNPVHDGTVILAHSLYIIIRKRDGITLDSNEICKTIFEDLTPGINTSEAAVNGVNENYIQDIQGSSISFDTTVYWKEAVGVHPSISITINTLPYYSQEILDEVESDLIQYLNSLPIRTDLSSNDILAEAIYADPGFKGKSTYTVSSVTVNGSTSYTNPGTFYKYTSMTKPSGTGTLTLTLS